MEIARLVETLDREGTRLGDAAERAGWRARVPSCPDWTVHDLVTHVGRVHRWATGFVARAQTAPHRAPEDPELTGPALLAWYRTGHAALVAALRAAPEDLESWTFFAAPTPLAFWARRQAHETTVHRVDAELALDGGLSIIDTDFAADGIAELLTGFHGQGRSRVRATRPGVLRLLGTDTGERWTLRLSEDPLTVERDEPTPGRRTPADAGERLGPAECAWIGATADLYLTLWNRPPSGVVRTVGDASLAELWRATSAIS
ncbi:maleylpyruvate isomerase family mycothiol-dependent enzyme [Streptomyces sp. NPDC057702]|uniref:maleylpyruvate isomerase family mycothiol-dependent enzyme n=1 Tax=unclassified Streptomyces TaxID=2593676 RepID=UPI00367A87B6